MGKIFKYILGVGQCLLREDFQGHYNQDYSGQFTSWLEKIASTIGYLIMWRGNWFVR